MKKKLSVILLILSLVFSSFWTTGLVFAEDISIPEVKVISWSLLDSENNEITELNTVNSQAKYKLNTHILLETKDNLKFGDSNIYKLAFPQNSEIGSWFVEESFSYELTDTLGRNIGSYKVNSSEIIFELNDNVSSEESIEVELSTEAIFKTDLIDTEIVQSVQLGNISQNVYFGRALPANDTEEDFAEIPEQSISKFNNRALAVQAVSNLAEFDEALADNAINTIVLTDNIHLDQTKEISTNKTLTVTSDTNGPYTLTIASKGRHFKLLEGSNFTIENVIIEGNNTIGGVRVNSTSDNRTIFNVSNTVFQNCKSTQADLSFNYGGAIDAYDSEGNPRTNYATITISGNSKFINNQAYYGGAISTAYQNISLEGNTSFQNNTVVGDGYGGSALFMHNTIATFKDNVTFTQNGTLGKEGGALLIYGFSKTSISGNVKFNENLASNGGAIMVRNGSITNTQVDISGNVAFTKNKADIQGGAICSNAGLVNIGTDNVSDIRFIENSTNNHYGGAIKIEAENSQSTLNVGAGTLFDSNSIINNSGGSSGGAIHAYSNGNNEMRLNIEGTSDRRVIFKNNSAASCGGALCIHGGGSKNISLIKYTDIVNNYSRNFGGGVDIDQAQNVTFDNCLIEGNVSDTDGGGIAMEDGHVDLVIKNSILNRNSAGGLPHSSGYRTTAKSGGAISFDVGTITISDSKITNNSAPENGGGIGRRNHATQATLLNAVKTTNTEFSGNTAKVLTKISETDKAIHTNNINPGETGKTYSQNLDWTYNNFDIQYSGDSLPLDRVTVTFDTRGGSPVPDAQTVDYGQGVYMPTTDPVRQFSNFEGWVTEEGNSWDFADTDNPNSGAPVRSNMTLYAKWRSEEFTITYELDGGTNDVSNPSTYLYGVGVASFADPIKDNKNFVGWFDSPTGGNQITEISKTTSGNITLYARWQSTEFNISYELDGGTNDASNPSKYTFGVGVPSFANPTKKGFTFEGWFDVEGNTITEISTTATGDKTLYAKWQKNNNKNPNDKNSSQDQGNDSSTLKKKKIIKKRLPSTGAEIESNWLIIGFCLIALSLIKPLRKKYS